MKPTQEQVIAWAREAGWYEAQSHDDCPACGVFDINAAFTVAYEAGRKDENEACAKVCEEYQDAVDRHKWPNGYECADAIRARREQ